MPPDIMVNPASLPAPAGTTPGTTTSGKTATGPPGADALSVLFASLLAQSSLAPGIPPKTNAAPPGIVIADSQKTTGKSTTMDTDPVRATLPSEKKSTAGDESLLPTAQADVPVPVPVPGLSAVMVPAIMVPMPVTPTPAFVTSAPNAKSSVPAALPVTSPPAAAVPSVAAGPSRAIAPPLAMASSAAVSKLPIAASFPAKPTPAPASVLAFSKSTGTPAGTPALRSGAIEFSKLGTTALPVSLVKTLTAGKTPVSTLPIVALSASAPQELTQELTTDPSAPEIALPRTFTLSSVPLPTPAATPQAMPNATPQAVPKMPAGPALSSPAVAARNITDAVRNMVVTAWASPKAPTLPPSAPQAPALPTVPQPIALLPIVQQPTALPSVQATPAISVDNAKTVGELPATSGVSPVVFSSWTMKPATTAPQAGSPAAVQSEAPVILPTTSASTSPAPTTVAPITVAPTSAVMTDTVLASPVMVSTVLASAETSLPLPTVPGKPGNSTTANSLQNNTPNNITNNMPNGLKSAATSADTQTVINTGSITVRAEALSNLSQKPTADSLRTIGTTRSGEKLESKDQSDPALALTVIAPTTTEITTETAKTAAPSLTAAERAAVIQQVADGVGTMPMPKASGATEQMTLQLHPKDWGKLHVSVTLTPGDAGSPRTVTAHIVADTPQVKAALESGQRELHQTLRAAGLHLEHLTVSVKPAEVKLSEVKSASDSAPSGMPFDQSRQDAAGGFSQGSNGQGTTGQGAGQTPDPSSSLTGGAQSFASFAGGHPGARQGQTPASFAGTPYRNEPEPEIAAVRNSSITLSNGRIDLHA